MRKLLAFILLTALLAALLPASASIYDPNAQKAFIKTSDGKGVNLRTDTNTQSQVLAKIPYGAEVLVYSDYAPNEWAHVQYRMMNGFVMSKFLVDRKPKPFVTPTPKPTAKPTRPPTIFN